MTEAKFRRATEADVPALLGLAQAFYREADYPFDSVGAQRSLLQLVASPRFGQAWLIEPDDTQAGYALLTFGFSLEYGGRDAILDELYVCPQHRGQGLGTAAIAHLEQICLTEGIRALHLEVERDNSAARLYRRLGFGVHNRDFMTKWLTP